MQKVLCLLLFFWKLENRLFILFTSDLYCYIVFTRGLYASENINYIHGSHL